MVPLDESRVQVFFAFSVLPLFLSLLSPLPLVSLSSLSVSRPVCSPPARLRVSIQNVSECTGKTPTCSKHVDVLPVCQHEKYDGWGLDGWGWRDLKGLFCVLGTMVLLIFCVHWRKRSVGLRDCWMLILRGFLRLMGMLPFWVRGPCVFCLWCTVSGLLGCQTQSSVLRVGPISVGAVDIEEVFLWLMWFNPLMQLIVVC